MTSSRPFFTILDHTADMGIRVWGANLSELFENAACALMQIMLAPTGFERTSRRKLSLRGEDSADLLVRWLGEILYLLEGEGKITVEITMDSITESQLEATLHVAPFDPDHHEILTEIKAVTYHQVEVVPTNGGWQASVIFDL